jgi:NADPH2:quinone reductase
MEEIPVPQPTDKEALVKIEYAALNPADRFMVEKLYPGAGELPFAVGRDGCGTIEKPATGGRFKQGQSVVMLPCQLGIKRDGTLADYVTVPEESLAPLPEGWSTQEGAAGPLVHVTAWQALTKAGPVTSETTVLITGASGGVGTATLQQAKAQGAKVVALSRSTEKQARLRQLGANLAYDPTNPDFMKNAKKGLSGGRVNIIVENITGPYLQKCIRLAGLGAKVSIVGLLAGLKSEIEIALLIFKQIQINGINVHAYTSEESQKAWEKIVALLNSSDQRPLIDRVFPMEQVQEAFAYLKQGPMGKVLVGSHTVSHPNLRAIPETEVVNELVQSKKYFESIIGKKITWFAYPGGLYNAQVRNVVSETGYDFAVTIKPGFVKPNSNPLEIPRVAICGSVNSPFYSLAKICGLESIFRRKFYSNSEMKE